MKDLFEFLMLISLFCELMERLDIEYIAIKRAKK